MSTRGWYEIYVADETSSRLELAMQFYKWGGAHAEDAVAELDWLESMLDVLNGELPVALVDDMIAANIGASRAGLPASFGVGYFLFLLLRADHDLRSPFWVKRCDDEQLRQQLAEASEAQGIALSSHPDRVVGRVHQYVAAGRLVHTWARFQHQMTFLQWLHRITTHSDTVHMGYLAGGYTRHWDSDSIFRIVVHVPRLDSPQPVSGWSLDVCDVGGNSLYPRLKDPVGQDLCEDELERERKVIRALEGLGQRRTPLEALRDRYDLVVGPFWRGELPRGDYIGP